MAYAGGGRRARSAEADRRGTSPSWAVTRPAKRAARRARLRRSAASRLATTRDRRGDSGRARREAAGGAAPRLATSKATSSALDLAKEWFVTHCDGKGRAAGRVDRPERAGRGRVGLRRAERQQPACHRPPESRAAHIESQDRPAGMDMVGMKPRGQPHRPGPAKRTLSVRGPLCGGSCAMWRSTRRRALRGALDFRVAGEKRRRLGAAANRVTTAGRGKVRTRSFRGSAAKELRRRGGRRRPAAVDIKSPSASRR